MSTMIDDDARTPVRDTHPRQVDFGYQTLTVRRAGLAGRWQMRSLIVCAVIIVAIAMAAIQIGTAQQTGIGRDLQVIGIIQRRFPLLRNTEIALQKQRQSLFILPFAIVIEFVEQHYIRTHLPQDGRTVTERCLMGLQGLP